ncbi:MAG: hypothetical protein KIT25_03005 [Enhydrobacter sp.]|nr:MAG: hypothetical protein KIT25_03005 [Enhydrobacter sp.]
MAATSGLTVSPGIYDSRSPWALSWPLVLGLAIFVFLNNARGLPLLADPDSHWHIAVGQWILAHRDVPTVDVYSFTFTGQPWIAKEWLSQVALAVAYELGGWGGVTSLSAGALGVTYAVLLRLLLRDIKPLPAILFTAAAAIMTAPHFLARPHVLAFPVMLIWVAGLVRAVEERRAPGPLLLLAMLLWANLHGGFTLGLLLVGAFALDALVGARDVAERRALFVAWLKFGIAAVLVACITPYGYESILVTMRIFSLGDALGTIAEWKSPNFQNQPMQELMLLVALYVALSRGLKVPLVRLLIVIGLVHLFLRYARNAELLAMLTPLVLAPVIVRQFPSLRFDPVAPADHALARRMRDLGLPAGIGAVVAGLALAGAFAVGMIRHADIGPPAANAPTAALEFARQHDLTGRVFNHYGFGGFLIGAGVPTFIDGRGELFGGDFIKSYVRAVALRGEEPFDAMLDRYRIDWTLLASDQAANKLLARLPGWREAYRDDVAVIFVRR